MQLTAAGHRGDDLSGRDPHDAIRRDVVSNQGMARPVLRSEHHRLSQPATNRTKEAAHHIQSFLPLQLFGRKVDLDLLDSEEVDIDQNLWHGPDLEQDAHLGPSFQHNLDVIRQTPGVVLLQVLEPPPLQPHKIDERLPFGNRRIEDVRVQQRPVRHEQLRHVVPHQVSHRAIISRRAARRTTIPPQPTTLGNTCRDAVTSITTRAKNRHTQHHRCRKRRHCGHARPIATRTRLHTATADIRRFFVTDAIRSGCPRHIAAKVYGHSTVDTTMGYAAIYPEDVIAHHRAFIARRRAERPSEEYRELTATEWNKFLAHFELRKVALGTCGRDHGTPCQHENACVRCPLLRVDPAQKPRLEEIHANLVDRLAEAKEQGWLGEVAAIETTMAAAAQKLEACAPPATRPSSSACLKSTARLDAPAPIRDRPRRVPVCAVPLWHDLNMTTSRKGHGA